MLRHHSIKIKRFCFTVSDEMGDDDDDDDDDGDEEEDDDDEEDCGEVSLAEVSDVTFI